jgi:CubicO group peptidase (beta-lactamase class C family)
MVVLPLAAQPLPVSAPEAQGLSTERLARMHRVMAEKTKAQRPPGAITMVVRNGHIVDWQTFGHRDVEGGLPMQKDTICHIYSMTKPITSVAIMMLVEEGRLKLNDPVEKFIPAFKALQVYKQGTVERPVLVPVERSMTVKHLLTHTAGFSYGWGNDNLSAMYQKAKVFEVASLDEFITNVAKLPLAAQPGERYEYSIGIDVLGYLVQVVSGQSFDQFVSQRILDPLKMSDTHFTLPESKRARLAKIYGLRQGALRTQQGLSTKGVPFGGMGLYSTIGDYARFAQMLVNSGELDGVRLLSRSTVDLMMKNHLVGMAKETRADDDSEGFGLGGSVRIHVEHANRLGSEGLFGWDGAASTRFRVDRKEKLAYLLFTQWMPFDTELLNLFDTLVYQAIAD